MTRDIVRRVYIYAAAFLGLQILLAGARGVVSVLVERVSSAVVGQPDQLTTSLSLNLALLICGLPLWGGHWWWAQRSIRAAEERRSALRRLYGYLVMLIAMVSLLFAVQSLVARILDPQTTFVVPALLGSTLINGLVWGYHWNVLRSDRALVEQAGAGATLRRWYLIIVQAISLTLAASSAIGLVNQLLQLVVVPAVGTRSTLTQPLAGLIAGLMVWLPHHLWARTLVQRPTGFRADETHSALRQVYAALVVTVAAVAALGGLTTVLDTALLAGLGGAAWRSVLVDHTSALGTAAIGGSIWWYHRAQLLADARRANDPASTITAQRTVGYLTSAIGLGALFFGLGGLLGTLLQLLFSPATIGSGGRDALSLGLALTIVAMPVFGFAAAGMERSARRSTTEEHSLARRIYLYAILLFGIVATITSIVQLVQLALGAALGNAAADTAGQFGRWFGYALVGCAIAVSYTLLLRRSGRVRADAGAGRTIVIVANEPLRGLLVAGVTRELPGSTLHIAGEHDGTSLVAQLTGADMLIVPLRVTFDGATAQLLSAFPGVKLVLPTAVPGYDVIGMLTDDDLVRALTRTLRTRTWADQPGAVATPVVSSIAA